MTQHRKLDDGIYECPECGERYSECPECGREIPVVEPAKPIESRVITADERDRYYHAKYRVITVIPLVEKPYMNTYIMSQEELDDFLDGYEEYAEFIVSVEQIESEDKSSI